MAVPDIAYGSSQIDSTPQVPWFLVAYHSNSRVLSNPSGTSGHSEGMWKCRGINAVWANLSKGKQETGRNQQVTEDFKTWWLHMAFSREVL